MRTPRIILTCLAIVIGLTSCAAWQEPPGLIAKNLTVTAAQTVERFRLHKDLKEFSGLLDQAHAVVILPTVIKAGFLAGGEAGNGVLSVRSGNGSWGQPAFFTLGAASFGLQFGVQDTAIVLIIRSADALQSVLKHQGKLGADTGATVGVVGVGMEASITTNLGADIVAFASSNIGAYLGASLEGAVLAKRHDLNEAFYGQGATVEAILAGQLKNPDADQLRQVLARN
jgi:SH3 domain-containing YSC84-like protein 1